MIARSSLGVSAHREREGEHEHPDWSRDACGRSHPDPHWASKSCWRTSEVLALRGRVGSVSSNRSVGHCPWRRSVHFRAAIQLVHSRIQHARTRDCGSRPPEADAHSSTSCLIRHSGRLAEPVPAGPTAASAAFAIHPGPAVRPMSVAQEQGQPRNVPTTPSLPSRECAPSRDCPACSGSSAPRFLMAVLRLASALRA